MKFLRNLVDKAIRRIGQNRRQLAAVESEWKQKCARLEKMWHEVHVENVRLRNELRDAKAMPYSVEELLRQLGILRCTCVMSPCTCEASERQRAKSAAVSACGCAICEGSKNISK